MMDETTDVSGMEKLSSKLRNSAGCIIGFAHHPGRHKVYGEWSLKSSMRLIEISGLTKLVHGYN